MAFAPQPVADLYQEYRIRNFPHYARYQLARPEFSSAEIDGTKLQFRTSTYTEYIRVRALMNEEGVLQDLLGKLEDDDVLFDIGANVGIFTCFAAAAVDSGTVVGFEPHPKNVESLEMNLDSNGLEAEVHQLALSDHSGEATLVETGSDAGEGSHHLGSDSNSRGLKTEIETADSFVGEDRAPAPTAVKIDVEGAELDVLRGGEETFSDPECRLLYCEVHPSNLSAEYGDVVDQIKQYGFEIEVVEGEFGSYSTLKAVK